MYTVTNYKSKKAVKEALALAIAEGRIGLEIYQPGPFAPRDGVIPNGVVHLEGPHYPEPHKWYATGTVRGGLLVAIK